jgi:hypothetical protein
VYIYLNYFDINRVKLTSPICETYGFTIAIIKWKISVGWKSADYGGRYYSFGVFYPDRLQQSLTLKLDDRAIKEQK